MLLTLSLLLAAQPAEPPVATVPVSPPPLVRAPVIDRTPPPEDLFQRAVPPRPVQPLASYVTSDDYPALAIRQGDEGLIEFALRVGSDGRPSGCSVLNQSGKFLLEIATCDVLGSRARFEPARDAAGEKVEGAVRGRIKWVMPPAPPVPDRVTIRHRIRADGTAPDCVLERVERGEIRREEDRSCGRLETPPEIMAAIRGQSALPEPHVRNEMRLLRNAADPWPAPASGERLLSRSLARLQVEADGQVSRCTVVETTTLIGRAPNPCRASRRIEPNGLALPAEVRIVTTVALEREPAPDQGSTERR